MADFYDMNAAIRPQNYFASFVQGQQAGRQAQQYQQAQEDRNFFRQMAPQVIAGDPNAYAQVAVRSPEVAKSYDESGNALLAKVKGMVEYFDRARSSGNPAAVQGAWKTISPFMARITGQQVPELYDEATEGPGLEQLKAKLAGIPAAQSEQFTLSPGSKRFDSAGNVVAEADFAPANAQFVEVPDGQGGSVRMVFDPRTRDFAAPSYGSTAGPQTATRFRTSSGEVIDIGQVEDPHVRQQILQDPAAWGLAPDGASAELPTRDTSPQQFGRGGMGYTPPKPQEAESETFSQPIAVINPETGRRELVQFGNRGGRRVVEDYAPEPPKGDSASGKPDDGLNDRQRVAVQTVQRNLIQYAAALTGRPIEELQGMSAQDIAKEVQTKGERFVQGGMARVMSNFPGGQTTAQVQNSDILSYSQGAGAAWAAYENPTGIITNADRESATAQMPNYLDPPEVQAAKIRSFLELSGWDRRHAPQAGAPAPPAGTMFQGGGSIPPQAIQYLRSNPNMRQQFEQKYGVSADQFLR